MSGEEGEKKEFHYYAHSDLVSLQYLHLLIFLLSHDFHIPHLSE